MKPLRTKITLKARGRFTPFWPTELAQIRTESTTTTTQRRRRRRRRWRWRRRRTPQRRRRPTIVHNVHPARFARRAIHGLSLPGPMIWFHDATCVCVRTRRFENEIRDTDSGARCAIWRNICTVHIPVRYVGSPASHRALAGNSNRRAKVEPNQPVV